MAKGGRGGKENEEKRKINGKEKRKRTRTEFGKEIEKKGVKGQGEGGKEVLKEKKTRRGRERRRKGRMKRRRRWSRRKK